MPNSSQHLLKQSEIEFLIKNPEKKLRGFINGISFSYYIALPDIEQNIKSTFRKLAQTKEILTENPFKHFGLIVEFDREIELELYDDEFTLLPQLKDYVSKLGLCIFKNVRIPLKDGHQFQKNIFPDLIFHVDRGHHFDNQFSLFYRNPDDPKHSKKRNTTTLIMPNAAVKLQAITEQNYSTKTMTSGRLFPGNTVSKAIGSYVLEHKWHAPEGTGEVCFFDNRTVLHASHHYGDLCYQIAVQYLY